MDEFDFIGNYLSPLAGPEGLKLKDDAACYTPPVGCDLIFTKDTLVEGVHFPLGRHGADTAEKLLRVNLSDLAAKGARPLGYLLSFAIPATLDPKMLEAFTKGLSDVQAAFDFTLWGGDTVSTQGPMVITATLIGAVPSGTMVKRSGASIGDDVWVTGTIGDAYLGMHSVLKHVITPAPDGEALWHWENAYLHPEPRILLRKVFRKYATAAVDISDGLIADISHIAKASDLGVKIEGERVPFSKPTQKWRLAQENNERAMVKLLTAGDDYEVAFTSGPENREQILGASKELNVPITRIGVCQEGLTARLVNKRGKIVNVSQTGFIHF